MNKRIRKLLSGVLAVMFVGQVMIYGDGSSQVREIHGIP